MKTYIEKYGVEAVKKHLKRKTRYFKAYSDYANSGTEVFNHRKFLIDIALPDFPIIITEQNGWNLPKAPTPEEFETIFNYLTIN